MYTGGSDKLKETLEKETPHDSRGSVACTQQQKHCPPTNESPTRETAENMITMMSLLFANSVE